MLVLGKVLHLRQVGRLSNRQMHQGVVDLAVMLGMSFRQHFLLVLIVLDQNDVAGHVLIHFLALLIVARLHTHNVGYSQVCIGTRLQRMRIGSLSKARHCITFFAIHFVGIDVKVAGVCPVLLLLLLSLNLLYGRR